MSFSEKYVNLLSGYEFYLYYISMLLVTNKILCHKPNKKPLIISTVTIVLLSIIIAFTNQEPASTLVFSGSLIVQFIFLKIIFPQFKTYYTVSLFIFLNCINILIISLVSPSSENSFWYFELVINTLTFILFIIISLTNIRLGIRQIIKLTPKYILIIILFILIITAVSSVIFLGTPFLNLELKWTVFSRLALIFVLLSVCLLLPVLLFNAVSSNHLKTVVSNYEKQINIQAEHYKQLAEANYEMRRFRHDFKNMSIALEELILKDEKHKSLKLIKELNNTLENPLERPYIFETGNGIADALISDKQAIALNSNIKINFQGSISTNILSPTDLCVVLGNTLDNAIEACQKLPLEQEKAISIQCKCTGNFLFYKIVNPVAEKVEITNNYITTSKENQTLHGFGLYSLNSVVKKYNGEIKLSSTDDEFSVNIDLCMV